MDYMEHIRKQDMRKANAIVERRAERENQKYRDKYGDKNPGNVAAGFTVNDKLRGLMELVLDDLKNSGGNDSSLMAAIKMSIMNLERDIERNDFESEAVKQQNLRVKKNILAKLCSKYAKKSTFLRSKDRKRRVEKVRNLNLALQAAEDTRKGTISYEENMSAWHANLIQSRLNGKTDVRDCNTGNTAYNENVRRKNAEIKAECDKNLHNAIFIDQDEEHIDNQTLFGTEAEAERTETAKGQPLFKDKISTLNIEQGDIGNCYLVASISAMASIHPEQIKDMVWDNNDGTATVRFYRQQYSDVNSLDAEYSNLLENEEAGNIKQNELLAMLFIERDKNRKLEAKNSLDTLNTQIAEKEAQIKQEAGAGQNMDIPEKRRKKLPTYRLLSNWPVFTSGYMAATTDAQNFDSIKSYVDAFLSEYVAESEFAASLKAELDRFFDSKKGYNYDSEVALDLLNPASSLIKVKLTDSITINYIPNQNGARQMKKDFVHEEGLSSDKVVKEYDSYLNSAGRALQTAAATDEVYKGLLEERKKQTAISTSVIGNADMVDHLSDMINEEDPQWKALLDELKKLKDCNGPEEKEAFMKKLAADHRDLFDRFAEDNKEKLREQKYSEKKSKVYVRVNKAIAKSGGKNVFAKGDRWVSIIEKAYAVSGLSAETHNICVVNYDDGKEVIKLGKINVILPTDIKTAEDAVNDKLKTLIDLNDAYKNAVRNGERKAAAKMLKVMKRKAVTGYFANFKKIEGGNSSLTLGILTGKSYTDKIILDNISGAELQKSLYLIKWLLGDEITKNKVGAKFVDELLDHMVDKYSKKFKKMRYSKQAICIEDFKEEFESKNLNKWASTQLKQLLDDPKNAELKQTIINRFTDYFDGNDVKEKSAHFEHRGLSRVANASEVKYTSNAKKRFDEFDKMIHEKHLPVCCGTKKYLPQDYSESKKDAEQEKSGLVQGHAYTMLDVYVDQDTGLRFVTLRNPWNSFGKKYEMDVKIRSNGEKIYRKSSNSVSKSSRSNGIFDMEFNDFLNSFVHYSAVE